MKVQILIKMFSFMILIVLSNPSLLLFLPNGFKHVKLSLYTANSNFEKKSNYIINYPKHWKLIKQKKNVGHAVFEDIKLEVKDKKIIFYVSNDFMNGSHLNLENRIMTGISSYSKTNVYDTVDVSGINVKKNLYWREKILGDIVIGYLDVPLSYKKEMDSVVSSIKKVQ